MLHVCAEPENAECVFHVMDALDQGDGVEGYYETVLHDKATMRETTRTDMIELLEWIVAEEPASIRMSWTSSAPTIVTYATSSNN